MARLCFGELVSLLVTTNSGSDIPGKVINRVGLVLTNPLSKQMQLAWYPHHRNGPLLSPIRD